MAYSCEAELARKAVGDTLPYMTVPCEVNSDLSYGLCSYSTMPQAMQLNFTSHLQPARQ